MTRALVFLATAMACFGQSPRFNRLIEHWRWMQYWQGATELGSRYQTGAQVSLLLFWSKDATDVGLGFCSPELHICQFYPNPSGDFGHTDLTMFPTEDAKQGFSRFVEEVFAQKPEPPDPSGIKVPKPPKPKDSDYATEFVSTLLPQLDPPPGVVERKMAPRDRIEALAGQFACSLDRPDCKYHLLIPYFGDADLWVPVYRACARQCQSSDSPSVTFFQWIKGLWWRGAASSTTAPDDVARIRGKIEDALMTEVGR